MDRIDAVLWGLAALLALIALTAAARAYEYQRFADAQAAREAAFFAEVTGTELRP